VTPIGINLPNDQAIREHYGSKSVMLTNITEAYDKAEGERFRLPPLGEGQGQEGRPHRHRGTALEDADVHVGTGMPLVRRVEVLLAGRRVFDRCHDASP
jgi:hypothetical protein